MPLACNENHVSRLCQHAGCLDGFAAVGDADGFLHVVFIQSRQHVVDDVLRLFKARVIGGDDDPVALAGRLLVAIDGTLAFVAVAAGAHNGNHFPFSFQHSVNGVQYIDQGVWSMGIVHNGGVAFR